MNKISKRIFMVFTISMLMLLTCQPILAEDIYDTQTTVTMYRMKYTDDTYGDVNITTTDNVFDDWVTYWNCSASATNWAYNESIGTGVQIGAVYENEAIVNTTTGGSVTCTYDTAYNVMWKSNVTWWLRNVMPEYISVNDTVPVLKLYMNISNRDIMNGAQEMWYRSPLKWDSSEYNDTGGLTDYEHQQHILNIFDSDGTLVYAGQSWILEDNRSYFKLNMRFYSDERYQFIEYIKTQDENPLNGIEVYFANYQDIGSDGEMDSYVFPGTPHARKFDDMELSWSMTFVIGIGRAGTEKMLSYDSLGDESYIGPGDGTDHWMWQIISQAEEGTINDVDYVNITIPFRCTERTTVRLNLMVQSGGTTIRQGSYVYENITGVISATIPFADPDAGETNTYWIELSIINATNGSWVTYMMYPREGIYHINNAVSYDEDLAMYWPDAFGTARKAVAFNHFAMYFEIEEGVTALGAEERCIRWDTVLIGTGVLLAGLFITAFAVPTGNIPLFLLGTGLIIGGAYTIVEGLNGIDPGSSTLGTIMTGVGNGIVQLAKITYDSLAWISENLWDGILWVVEQIKMLGEAVLHWGGIIFGAIAEFVYLLAFLAVVWIWAKFLKIMTGIVKGDIDAALATTTQVIRKGVGVAKKVYRPAKKAGKFMKKRRK